MKKRIFIIIMFVLGATLVSLSLLRMTFGPRAVEPRYGGVYKIPVKHALSQADPRKAVWVDEKNLLQMIFDPLIRNSGSFTLEPGICVEWLMAPDLKSFECKIRNDVVFHDGRPLSVGDVVFSLNYILAKGGLDAEEYVAIHGIREYWNGETNRIAGIYAVGGDRVRIDLELGQPAFADMVANQRLVVLPEDLRGRKGDDFFKSPVGTGPFKVAELGKVARLVANKKYYQGRPYLDEVKFLQMNDVEAVAAIERGDVHDLRFYEIPGSFGSGDNVRIIPNVSYSNLILIPNNSVPPFDRTIFRELLYSLVDKRNTLAACSQLDTYIDSIVPSGVPGYVENDLSGRYDLKAAARILAELGRQGRRPVAADIYYVKDEAKECIASKINANFEKFGVPWRIVPVSSDELVRLFFEKKLKAHIEALNVKNADAYSVLKYFSMRSAEDLPRINDSEIEGYLDESLASGNPYVKAGIYQKINRRIMDMAYAYPIREVGNIVVYSNRVRVARSGALDDRYVLDMTKLWLD